MSDAEMSGAGSSGGRPGERSDEGPWEFGLAMTGPDRGKAYVDSNDGRFEVRMVIEGNFDGTEDRLAYAEAIAKKLNSSARTS